MSGPANHPPSPYRCAKEILAKRLGKGVYSVKNACFPMLALVFSPWARAGTVDAIDPGSATKGSLTNLNL
jgi:hypothetical protein